MTKATTMTLMMMLMMMSRMRLLHGRSVAACGRHLCRICVDDGRGQLASRMMMMTRRAVPGPCPKRLTLPLPPRRGC